MKIKTSLTLKFSLIVTALLIVFASVIYYFSAEYRIKEFHDRLKNRAVTIANVMDIVLRSDASIFDSINRNTVNLLFNENDYIYDYHTLALKYSSCAEKMEQVNNEDFFMQIKKDGIATDTKGEREISGISYPSASPKYIVVVSATDQYGKDILHNLKMILLISILASLFIVVISAFFYAYDSLRPISYINDQIDRITASKLHSRVNTGHKKDEIYNLAVRFNTMLDRLEDAFVMQKQFVSNASHELRTPLTSMKGQIEVTLMNEREKSEYKEVLESLMTDIQNMTTLVNGFLEMAEASNENKLVKIENVRLDELLFAVKNEITRRNPNYILKINFDTDISEEKKLTLTASPHLLKVLFSNLIDNACKFSNDHTANVLIQCKEKWIRVDVGDYGIGIPFQDIDKVTEPFYRASNVTVRTGHGVGLSIVKKIVSLHKGKMEIKSEVDRGTTIMVLLPYDPRQFAFNNDDFNPF